MATREGYLYVDHRASPGLPEPIARRMGGSAGEKLHEIATLTCSHCKTVQIKNPLRIRERGFCSKCSHYVCDICEAKMHHPDYIHVPFDKLVDIIQTQRALLGSPTELLISPTLKETTTHG
jgi:hypothetical protein